MVWPVIGSTDGAVVGPLPGAPCEAGAPGPAGSPGDAVLPFPTVLPGVFVFPGFDGWPLAVGCAPGFEVAVGLAGVVWLVPVDELALAVGVGATTVAPHGPAPDLSQASGCGAI